MGRWEPNARGRLERAAMELYSERGFEETTVAEIAQRAGLTERTFFRHFADKREVLFAGAQVLEDLIVAAVAAAPADAAPLDVVAEALAAGAAAIDQNRDYAPRRRRIIAASTELRERELQKGSRLSAALAAALRERGVVEPAARLAAETGVGVFSVAFARWCDEVERGSDVTFVELIAATFEELRRMAAGAALPAAPG